MTATTTSDNVEIPKRPDSRLLVVTLPCFECEKEFRHWSRWEYHYRLRHPEAPLESARRRARLHDKVWRIADGIEKLNDEWLYMLVSVTRYEAARRDWHQLAESMLPGGPPPVPAGPGDVRTRRSDQMGSRIPSWTGTIRVEIDVEEWPGGFSGWRWSCTRPGEDQPFLSGDIGTDLLEGQAVNYKTAQRVSNNLTLWLGHDPESVLEPPGDSP